MSRRFFHIIIIGLTLLIPSTKTRAEVNLTAGDIAVVLFNSDGTDEFALLALADVPANSVIFVTDASWGGTDFTSNFFAKERIIRWTTSSVLSAGTIIRFDTSSSVHVLENSAHGSLTYFDSGGTSLSSTALVMQDGGDQIAIYQTSDNLVSGDRTFIYAFSSHDPTPADGWSTDASGTDVVDSRLYSGLTAVDSTGSNKSTASAFAIAGLLNSDVDNWRYNSDITAASKSDWLTLIHTTSNWVSDNTTAYSNNEGALATSNFTVGASTDSDGNLAASATVSEPVALTTTVTATGSAVDVFDFTISDGGASDGVALTVSQVVLNTSGTGDFSKVVWRLSGNDASNVTGTYSSGANTITFASLSISVADGASETYTVNAYYSDNTGLTEGQTFILSVDGDTDLTVGSSGSTMGTTTAVTNGTGSTVDVTATKLVFTTQPAPLTTTSSVALDFTTDPVVTAQDAAGNTDTGFTSTVTLTENGSGTATYTNNSQAASSGVATLTGLTVTYTAAAVGETFTLQAAASGVTTAESSAITASGAAESGLAASGTVSEPVALPTTATATGSAVNVFDFTVSDGGGDGFTTGVSQVVLNTSGTGDFSKVVWRLNGNDASNVTGTYSSGNNTITFASLSISVADGASETYTVNAYYNDNTSLTEGQTFILSVDGDTDLTVSSSGSTMGTTSAVTNGTGSTVDVTATKLVYTTQPAPLTTTSGTELDFTTDPVVTAQDAAGNTDTGFTSTVTLTENGSGTATYTNNSQAASSGVATFTGLTVTYTAAAVGETFTLQAAATGVTAAEGSAITASGAVEGGLAASGTVSEPVALPTTATATGSAVNVFDFTVSDGGGDGFTTGVSQVVLNTSGTGDFSKVVWRLNGNDASNVTGTYSSGANTITFASLSISVADGASETYTVNAYYNDNTSLAEGQTFILSVDGDTDLTVSSSGSTMGTTSAVTNGTGSTVDVTATKLVYTTQPAPLTTTSGTELDFTTDPVVTAQDAAGNTDTGFTSTVTLTENGSGTATYTNNSQAASSGVATLTGLTVTYTAAAVGETFTLQAAASGVTAAESSEITASGAVEGGLAASGTVSEPVALPTTATATGSAVSVFDFTVSDGGGDGFTTGVSQVVLNTSGTGDFSKVVWRLNGNDASNVTGTYSSGANTITFASLSISVADGASETYTVNAYYNDNTGLTEGQTFILSVDGDTDLTVSSSGSTMGTTSAVTNGTGTTVDVTATKLAYTTQPAPVTATSGAALDFTTDPVVTAQDAAGNTDTGFTSTVTLTENGSGTATYTNNSQAASSGVATFTGLTVTYTAAAVGETFTLQAAATGVTAADSSAITASGAAESSLAASGTVSEPVALPTTATATGSAVNVFDFGVSDGGGDGFTTGVSQVVLNTSGTGDFSKVVWRLNGNDASNVTGTYSSGANTITFASLSISVGDGASESYTVNAYYADNTGLTEGQTFILSVDGDTDLTVSSSGSTMGTTSAVTNGTGSTVDVTATKLVYTTQPAPLTATSGAALDFTTDPVVTAQDAAGNTDTGFTSTVTLTENGSGTATYTNNSQAASSGVATFTDMTVTYIGTTQGETFSLQAAGGSLTAANSSNLTANFNTDGNLAASATVSEPVVLPTTTASTGAAVDVFDFTISDGGASDGQAFTVSQVVLHTSGTGDYSKVVWRLNGSDASNVTGTYSSGANTITFASLSISVADGSSETYTVNAYYSDNTGLTEGLTFIMSVDGDTDLTVGSSGTQIGTTSAVTNGTGSTVDVTATKLAYTTQPAPLTTTSGTQLDFTTDPVVTAQDAAGNTDTGFTSTVTLTENGNGTATYTNNSQAASSGLATFTDLTVTYTSVGTGETFTLQAVGGGLTAADSSTVVISNEVPTTANLNSDSFTFTEGGSATVIDQSADATVADVDSADFSGGNLTVTIASGEDAAEDVLSLDTSGSVSLAGTTAGSNVSISSTVIGTLANAVSAGNDLVVTLDGNSTPGNVQTLVRAITYQNTDSDDPTTGARTVRVTVNDGDGGTSANADVTVTVAAVNDAPVVATTTGSAAYTENASAATIDSGVAVSDVDDTQIASGSVSVTAGFTTADELAATTTGTGVTASYNSSSGVLTLTGIDTLANYQTVLRTVTFSSSSEDPTATAATRTITFAVTDANSDGAGAQNGSATRGIDVTPLNDAPVVATTTGSAAYTENASAVIIDSAVAVSDVDDTQVASGSASVTSGFTTGDILAATTTGTSVTASYNSSTGVLSLSGTDTLANYLTVLQSVAYSSSSEDLTSSSASRTITFAVTDANSDGVGGQSGSATRNIDITAVNDALVVATTAGSAAYTENASAVTIDSAVTVSDTDDTHIANGSVSVTTGFTTGDTLAATTTGTSVTASYNSSSGVLSLSGTDTLANYQTVLQSVSYSSSSEDPTATATSRTITFAVTDANSDGGGAESGSATRGIDVTPSNDAPALAAANPTLTTLTEDETTNSGHTVASVVGSSISDVDSGAQEGVAIVSLSSGNGSWQYSVDSGGNWSGVGAVAETTALLLREIDSIRFVPDGQNATTATVTYRAWDRTSGTEGTKSDTSSNGTSTAFSTTTDTASIVVTAVNDAPTLAGGPFTLTETNEDTASVGTLISDILAGVTHGDVDTGAASGITVSAQSGNGTWQYSTDGNSWTGFGTLSGSSALHLASGTQIRYVPDNQNAETGSITFQGWDQTSGTASSDGTPQSGDSTSNGGTSAYSTGTALAEITVTAVNDAPILAAQTPNLGTTDEDTTTTGITISSFVTSGTGTANTATGLSDVDTGAVRGIALSGKTGNGAWEYSADGTSWTAVGTVSSSAALLLPDNYQLHYVPDNQNAETPTLTYFGWDQSSGASATNVDLSGTGATGGTTAFSTATDTASLTVTAVNDTPVLAAFSPTYSVIEHNALSLTASASDVDSPADTLTFSLDSGAPVGAAINSSTGAFSWTPSESQGPAATEITVRVTDDGTSNLSATRTFVVNVGESVSEPILGAVTNQVLTEGETMNVVLSASDNDQPANILTFSLDSGPGGMTVDGSSGLVTWATGEADGPGTYSVTVRVSDDGTIVLFAVQSFTVSVSESNSSPVIAAIGDQTVNENETLTLQISGSDSDIPANQLTFALSGDAPAGATLDAANGQFSWTPTEAQGPGTYPITVQVQDNGNPALTGTQTFQVVVDEVNQAPTLPSFGGNLANEEEEKVVLLAAFDADEPVQTITWKLGADAPEGLTLDSTVPALRWTPTEAQGPGVYSFGIEVTDDGTPAQTVSSTVTIAVTEINKAPVLAEVGPQSVVEGEILSVNLSATDADLPAQQVSYSLGAGASVGAFVNPVSGQFTWLPSEAEGPGSYTITVIATDNGTPALSDSVSFTVVVTEGNRVPILAPTVAQVVDEGQPLNVVLAASDPDLPSQILAYGLGSDAPAGVSVDSATGLLSWTPSEE